MGENCYNSNYMSMEGSHQQPEKTPIRVVLHFMRHSIKEKAPEKKDEEVRLTSEGCKLASEKFKEPLDMRFTHIAGSSRIRTHETAAAAATKNPDIALAELGTGKLRTKEALDFAIKETGGFAELFNEAAKNGKLMSFLMKESDAKAKELGDTTSSTYSKMAANIASIILQNFKVASRGVSILEKSNNPQNTHNDFERVFATHQTIQESFLLKLIEKVGGTDAQDKFFAAVGENGFGFNEGFDVTFSKEDGKDKIRVTYKKGDYVFDEVVPVAIIEEIVSENS